MVQLSKIDNSWLQPSSQKGKATSDKSMAVGSKAEKKSQETDFSPNHDFNSTLKSKLPTPKDDTPIDGRDNSNREIGDDTEPVSLADSEAQPSQQTTSAPVHPAVMKMKAVAPKAHASPTQAMDHRLAWNDFLHKMKSKLGVSAQDILAAFKSLTKEELSRPPEQNIAKLVQHLGLNDQQAATARLLFQELIVKTDAQPLRTDAHLASDGGPLAVMNQHETRQKKMQASLKEMNQQFFMKEKPHPTAIDAKDSKKDLAAISSGEPPHEASRSSNSSGIAIPTELMKAAAQDKTVPPTLNLEHMTKAAQTQAPMPTQIQSPQVPAHEHQKQFIQPAVWQQPQDMTSMTAPNVTTAALSAHQHKFLDKNTNSPTPSLDPNSVVTPTPMQQAPITTPVAPVVPAFGGGAPQRNHDDNSDDPADGSKIAIDDAAINSQNAFTVNGKGDAQATQELKKNMPAMAVPDLVQQAHVMMKDGGGEMNVVLAPEGLGQVAMKVSVKDGKVSVEAVTQSDEAKKMLQDSFHALHDTLNAHHLSLESIKVDTASNVQTQLEQQYRDAQRNQAQQFLENFHQDNRNWRQSFFDIPGAQVYRSQSQRPGMGAPTTTANNRSSSSRRLDLVA